MYKLCLLLFKRETVLKQNLEKKIYRGGSPNFRIGVVGGLLLILTTWAVGLWLGETAPARDLKRYATGTMVRFDVFHDPQVLPHATFLDHRGQTVTFDSLKGKTVLVNFWATWCEPCRHEMPSLARLHAALASDNFAVVAVSIDLEGYGVIDPFLNELKISALPVYWDRSNRTVVELQTRGLPLTILIDRHGRWIGRLEGPAAWDSQEAQALLKAAAQL